MKIYGLPSEDRTKIIEQRRADSKKWLVVPGIDGPVINATHDQYILAGWVLYVAPVIGENQYRGEIVITDEEWTYLVIDKTFLEIRTALERAVYQKCNAMLSAAVIMYSNAEMSQWAEMVAKAQAENWTYFDAMTIPGLTGEQYAAVVLQKYAEYKLLFDGCLSVRNTHKVNIAATADKDLINYDVSTGWAT